MPKRLLGLSDIARELGLTIQVVSNWHTRGNGRLPTPTYLGPNEAPLWTRAALEKAQVLETVSNRKSTKIPSTVSVTPSRHTA